MLSVASRNRSTGCQPEKIVFCEATKNPFGNWAQSQDGPSKLRVLIKLDLSFDLGPGIKSFSPSPRFFSCTPCIGRDGVVLLVFIAGGPMVTQTPACAPRRVTSPDGKTDLTKSTMTLGVRETIRRPNECHQCAASIMFTGPQISQRNADPALLSRCESVLGGIEHRSLVETVHV